MQAVSAPTLLAQSVVGLWLRLGRSSEASSVFSLQVGIWAVAATLSNTRLQLGLGRSRLLGPQPWIDVLWAWVHTVDSWNLGYEMDEDQGPNLTALFMLPYTQATAEKSKVYHQSPKS